MKMPGLRKFLRFVANEPVLAILVVALPSIKAAIAALGIDTHLRAFVAGAVLSPAHGF